MHYILHGAKEGRLPHPQSLYALRDEGDPDLKSLAVGEQCTSQQAMSVREWKKRVEQSGFFNAEWYLKTNADVAQAGLNPLDHFIRFGSVELRNPSPKFDARWYVEEYPEVTLTRLEPLAHYLTIGRQKGSSRPA